jgi:adenylate kinase family enzyme
VQRFGNGSGTIYWIGGGSGAGKSTVARLIAARRGLRLYATDDVMADHAAAARAKAPRCCTGSWQWTWISDG